MNEPVIEIYIVGNKNFIVQQMVQICGNFCKYRGKSLFIRYKDKFGRPNFTPVKEYNKIHLHDYNVEIRNGNEEAFEKMLSSYAVVFGPSR